MSASEKKINDLSAPSKQSFKEGQTVDISSVTVDSTVQKSATSKSGSNRRPSDTSAKKTNKQGSTPSISKTVSGDGGGSSTSWNNASSAENIQVQGIALGMIETRGLVPAIEAADAMTKAAEVTLISREFVGGGYVTVMVRGETGAVNASVRAGADACERVGDGLVAAHIIARPHLEIEPVLKASKSVRRG